MANALEELTSSYKGKTVVVTGHTGFKGSWLSTWLTQLGAKVFGISDGVPTTPSIFRDSGEVQNLETFWIDICETNKIARVLKELKPDFVFHLAAQPIVSTSFENPLETWRVNTLGTVSILDAIRVSNVDNLALVLITSDKVYRNVEWSWGYRENDLLGGFDPYSASKASAELAFQSYFESNLFQERSVRGVSVRAGNVIGGGDWATSRIVPDAIRAWLDSSPLLLRNLTSTRPWQHVLEPLGGYLLAGQSLARGLLKSGESLNFGPNDQASRSVSDLVGELKTYLDPIAPLDVGVTDGVFKESVLLRLSSEKARALIGWAPLLDFETTLEWTARWYVENAQGANALRLVRRDISAFEDLLAGSELWGRA
jgi:CDP-glucose 4,6-dehydratase